MLRNFTMRILVLSALLIPAMLGCNQLSNPDNIRIAKFEDEYITRGDLYRILREMNDTERPNIRSKTDFIRVINRYIDTEIKIPLGIEMAEAGKVNITREQALEEYFRRAGEDEKYLRRIYNLDVEEGSSDEALLEVYGLSKSGIEARKSAIDADVEYLLEELQGEKALELLALESLKAGKITIDKELVQREYENKKDSFKKMETITFIALRFPASHPKALEYAAQVRRLVDQGANFDTILAQAYQENKDNVFESQMQNNPNEERFRGFWQAASGAKVGDVIGPVFLPEFQKNYVDASGQMKSEVVPATHIVFKVIDHTPATSLSYEEAKTIVAIPLVIAEQMKILREEHGVEIYEDKFPDPMQYQQEYGQSMGQL